MVALELQANTAVEFVNHGADEAEFLLLQGRPIGELVVKYGPFVMNTEAEIHQTLRDYQKNQFGGWPWADDAPVHGPEASQFLPASPATPTAAKKSRPKLEPCLCSF